jgi:hypothetical protein
VGDPGGPSTTPLRRVGEPGVPGVSLVLLGEEEDGPGLAGAAVVVAGGGISNHSSPPIILVFKKKGQRSQSIDRLSIASAVASRTRVSNAIHLPIDRIENPPSEIGTLDDFTTALTTSLLSSVLLFRAEVVIEAPLLPLAAKSIQTASAIVPSRPRIVLRLSSSASINFVILLGGSFPVDRTSALTAVFFALPSLSFFARIRSYKAALLALVGVSVAIEDPLVGVLGTDMLSLAFDEVGVAGSFEGEGV